MPYSDDPLNVPADEVRVLLGDTSTSPDLSDNTILYLLSKMGSPLRAAARGAELLASKYSKVSSDRQVGPLRVANSRMKAKSEEFARLARTLWARAAAAGGAPYAGGISQSDKESRAADGDRVRPAFTRGMMPYPRPTPSQVTEDDLLSPENT